MRPATGKYTWTQGSWIRLRCRGSTASSDACTDNPGPGGDPKERQAHQFMGFLLMPSHLLRETIRDVDLLSWQNLYELRDLFQVTITVLTVRLARLNLLYISDDRKLYPSRQCTTARCHWPSDCLDVYTDPKSSPISQKERKRDTTMRPICDQAGQTSPMRSPVSHVLLRPARREGRLSARTREVTVISSKATKTMRDS